MRKDGSRVVPDKTPSLQILTATADKNNPEEKMATTGRLVITDYRNEKTAICVDCKTEFFISDQCPICQGLGEVDASEGWNTCLTCGGSGRVELYAKCSGHRISLCPWCCPDSKPWTNGRGI
jgi:RecJ-like exonuclease